LYVELNVERSVLCESSSLDWIFASRIYRRTQVYRVETEWATRQEHRFKDQLVNGIVDAVANNQDLDWTGKINFFDEVYIQKLLNDRGITLLDHDTWPTTTQKFWEIIK
jgi:hypothetical protein